MTLLPTLTTIEYLAARIQYIVSGLISSTHHFDILLTLNLMMMLPPNDFETIFGLIV